MYYVFPSWARQTMGENASGDRVSISRRVLAVVVAMSIGVTGFITAVQPVAADTVTSCAPSSPGCPTGVTAVAKVGGSADITWNAASFEGGSDQRSYTATAKDLTNGSRSGQTCSTSGTSCTISGLTPGDQYTFSVTASNRVCTFSIFFCLNYATRTSSASLDSLPVTIPTVPDAPTAVTALGGDTIVSVTWTAPTNNGGSPITGYVATTSSTSSASDKKTCSSTTTGCTITGLGTADRLRVTVTATNAVGTSVSSAPSSETIIGKVPGKPEGLIVTASGSTALVSWNPPTDPGSLPITSFVVSAVDQTTPARGGQGCTASPTLTPQQRSCVLFGITPGDLLSISVVAVNPIGTSAPASATLRSDDMSWTAVSIPSLTGINTGGRAAITAVNCPTAGNCSAAGYFDQGNSVYAAFTIDQVGGTWGRPTAVQVAELATLEGSNTQIEAIDCASAGNCTAVGSISGWNVAGGSRSPVSAGFAMTRTSGVWGEAKTLPTSEGLRLPRPRLIACASAGNCTVAGEFSVPSRTTATGYATQVFTMNQANGRWSLPVEIRGLGTLNRTDNARAVALSCPDADSCTLAGIQFSNQGQDGPRSGTFLASESKGVWGPANELAPKDQTFVVSALSCSAASTCTVGGVLITDRVAALAAIAQTNGIWGDPTTLLDSGSTNPVLSSLSCSVQGECAASGYLDSFDFSGGNRVQKRRGFVVASTSGKWGDPILVPGEDGKTATADSMVPFVSCAPDNSCTALAQGSAGLMSVTEKAGKWAIPTKIPGTIPTANGSTVANAFDCASSGDCTVGGVITACDSQAILASATGGTWSKAFAPEGFIGIDRCGDGPLTAISCPTNGNCSAGGYYTDAAGKRQAKVVDQLGGEWQPARQLPGIAAVSNGDSEVLALSCPAPGTCTAVGYFTDAKGAKHAFTSDRSPSGWTAAVEPKGLAAAGSIPALSNGPSELRSVTCPSVSRCVAVGFYTASGITQPLLIERTGTAWGTATALNGIATLGQGGKLLTVSCSTAGVCVAGGSYIPKSDKNPPPLSRAMVITGASGSWSAPVEVKGTALSGSGDTVEYSNCSSDGLCGVGGSGNAGSSVFLTTIRSGVVGNAVAVPGLTGESHIQAISCPGSGSCLAGGYSLDTDFQERAFITTLTDGTWSTASAPAGIGRSGDRLGLGVVGSRVSAIDCAAPLNCAIGGQYTDTRGDSWAFTNRLMATGWREANVVGGPLGGWLTGGEVLAVSCSPNGSCSVAGSYLGPSYQALPFVALAGQAAVAKLPSAPTKLVAVAGFSQVRLRWEAPTTPSLLPITGYTATDGAGRSCTTNGATTCVVTGLTNGTSYRFTVVANNAFGSSPASVAVSATPTIGAPDAPLSVTAVAGSGKVDVSWSPPASDGGSVITGYTVSDGNGRGCTTKGSTSCRVTGLTDNDAFTFTVTSTNAKGTSQASDAVTVMVGAGVPSTPKDPFLLSYRREGESTANPRTVIIVGWYRSAYAGADEIRSYTLSGGGARPCSTQPDPDSSNYRFLSCELTFPADFAASTVPVTIVATNKIGDSAPATFTARLTSRPGSPTITSVVAGSGSAAVSWSPSIVNYVGGATFMATDGKGHSCTSSETSCTISDLADGTTATITVTATTSGGTSDPSAAVSAVIGLPAPDVPGALAATPQPGSAVITWTAPDPTGHAAVSGYRVFDRDGRGCTAGATATSCTVTGLTDGTLYAFRIRAQSSAGNSAASMPVLVVPGSTVPGQPTKLTAVPGKGSVTLTWSAPAISGASPVTGYVVESSGPSCKPVGTATSCLIEGLPDGVTYVFSIRALNAIGASAPSTTATATIGLLPTFPLNARGIFGNGSVTVTWGAPIWAGTTPITRYEVTDRKGHTCSTTGALSCVVTDLTNGTAYTFYVTAINASGSSPAMATQTPTTPKALAPDAPSGLRVTTGNGSATLFWTAPAFNGSPITGYTATDNFGHKCTAVAPATSCQITGLTNGGIYQLSVKASNVMGTSPASATISTPPINTTAPSAPITTLNPSPGRGEAYLLWTAPATNGGVTITRYDVTDGAGHGCTTTGATGCTVTGLTNGQSYRFDVTATNAAGTSIASKTPAVTPLASPGIVSGLRISTTANSATVSWQALPNDPAVAPVTQYNVSANQGTCVSNGPTSCVFSNLAAGSNLLVTVTANSNLGAGPAASKGFVVVGGGVPGAVSAPSVTASDRSATISWALTTNGGATITSYTASDGQGHTCSPSTIVYDSVFDKMSCTLTGLTNGQRYTVSVAATNSFGAGAAGTVEVTPAVISGAPTAVKLTPGYQSLVASWTAPANNGGGTIIKYTATDDQGHSCTAIAPSTTCTISDLTAGTSYAVTVVAINSAGTSNSSGPASAKALDRASAPQSLTATSSGTSITLSWAAPSSNGGSAITGYRATEQSTLKSCSTSGATTCTISGLTAGTYPALSVVAITAAGDGASARPDYFVIGAGAPGVPRFRLEAGDRSAKVWLELPIPGGGPTTSLVATDGKGHSCTVTLGGTLDREVTCTITGLTNGSESTITATAVNSIGTSAASAPVSITPAGPPSAPLQLSAVAGDRSITFTWKTPIDTGGAPLDRVMVKPGWQSNGNFICSTDGKGTTCTIDGLTNGIEYPFVAVAYTMVGGYSADSEPVKVTPFGLPSAPGKVVLLPGDRNVTASWLAPDLDGFSPITGYIASDGKGHSCTTSGLSCTIVGLTNDQSAAITVSAINARGTGPVSPSAVATPRATPASAPGRPLAPTAQSANGSVTVSWSAPAFDGGATITSYLVSDGPNRCTTTGATRCTITGLVNGQRYQFNVVAINAAGPSQSSASVVGSPVGPPGAPVAVNATQELGRTTISWSAPGSDGGSDITGYTVSDGNGRSCTTTAALTCSVSGLTNGTAYTFSVIATNALGSSTAATVKVTVGIVPSAPAAPTVRSGDGQATVSWTAPAPNGSSVVTGYSVSDGQGHTCTTAGALSCTVTGLTNGVTYSITVVAINVIGSSSASPSTAATPKGAPSSPAAPLATIGDRKVTLTWVAPAANGSPVTGYTVSDGQGRTCTTTGSTSCTVTGLTNGTSYSFTVVATNAIGSSSPSPAVSATPAGPPAPPSGLQAVAGDGRATFSWTAPSSDNGAAITGYTVSDVRGRTCSTTGALTCMITGLVNGSASSFTVVATNKAGNSSPSTAVSVTPIGPPPAPQQAASTAGDSSATITWKAPSTDGGSPITGYTVSDGKGKGCTTSVALTCTVTGLTNGTWYTFSVTATNTLGVSVASNATNVRPAKAPSAPQSVKLTKSNNNLIVSWSAPQSDGGSLITGYVVTASPGTARCSTSGSETSCILTGLTAGTAYTVSVYAENAAGRSPLSSNVVSSLSLSALLFTASAQSAIDPETRRNHIIF